ncbi:MAG: hypothetical protein AB7S26_29465 [Sandaracinaceae bacterium]
MRRPSLALTIALAATACGATHDSLRARAALELACDEATLETEVIDGSIGNGRTVEVRGCGRSARYTQMCDASAGELIRNCAWTR